MKREKIFIVTFLVIIYGVFVCYIFNEGLIVLNKKELVITDNWQFYQNKKENIIVDKVLNKYNNLKTNIENKSSNYFPGYLSINSSYQDINFQLNKLIYQDVPIKKNADNDFIFYDKDKQFYYVENHLSSKELENRYQEQLHFFNKLQASGTDVYIYFPTRYEYFTNSELKDYLEKFNNNCQANTKIMNIKDNSEYQKLFFKTDHHWNIFGATKGYNEIMNLLNKEPITNFNYEKKDIKLYGSFAKTALSNRIYDFFYDIDLQLDYQVEVNDSKADSTFKPREISKRSNLYHDYYVQYFNGQYEKIVYKYDNEAKDNLLILSDSYAWPIDYLIASHYHETHVFNLRYSKDLTSEFDIKTYMNDHDIDKVLFLYEAGSILFDQYDYNFIERIK